MRLVIIESPYAGSSPAELELNLTYARRAVRDSLGRGEAPIASHLLYTQEGILDDNVPQERAWGIDAGLAWRKVAHASVVYSDLGLSKGMRYGIDAAIEAGIPVQYRLMLSQLRVRPTDVKVGVDQDVIYRNYRGETERRTIRPMAVYHGSTSYHPQPQWLVTGVDVSRDVQRVFALSDMAFA